MTYLNFHFIFIFPVILLLLLRTKLNKWQLGSLLLIDLIALVYTIPWDTHLIDKGVWTYPTNAVIGTIGLIPIEEYMFIILQPILSGLWVAKLANQSIPSLKLPDNGFIIKMIGGIFWFVLAILGYFLLKYDSGYYFGITLAWAAPIIGIQWMLGGDVLWALRKTWLLGFLVPTLYLCIADRIAIGQGIWEITRQYSTEIFVFGLPVEEINFFLLTNLLVVQGLLLFLCTIAKFQKNKKQIS